MHQNKPSSDTEALKQSIFAANAAWREFDVYYKQREIAVEAINAIWPIRNNNLVNRLVKEAIKTAIAHLRTFKDAYSESATQCLSAELLAKTNLTNYFIHSLKLENNEISFFDAERAVINKLSEILGYDFENIGCEFPCDTDFILGYLLVDKFINRSTHKFSHDLKKFSKTEKIKLSELKNKLFDAISWQLTMAFERCESNKLEYDYEEAILEAFMKFYGMTEDECDQLDSSENISDLDFLSKTLLSLKTDEILNYSGIKL